ncbi:MAG: hypothetical protein PHT51_05105 [Patescibacteria group bacterium]|nr:hypothetical protein [Patescibacteria group bacterium]MDD4610855.1 hypothetical protein [Patescibacteria group bacterium]
MAILEQKKQSRKTYVYVIFFVVVLALIGYIVYLNFFANPEINSEEIVVLPSVGVTSNAKLENINGNDKFKSLSESQTVVEAYEVGKKNIFEPYK